MIKMLVSDLDGTLIDKKNQVAPQDVKAMKKLRAHDVDIFLASGRMDNEIMEVAKVIGDQYHRVSQNGAFVITNEHVSLQIRKRLNTSLQKGFMNRLVQIETSQSFVPITPTLWHK